MKRERVPWTERAWNLLLFVVIVAALGAGMSALQRTETHFIAHVTSAIERHLAGHKL